MTPLPLHRLSAPPATTTAAAVIALCSAGAWTMAYAPTATMGAEKLALAALAGLSVLAIIARGPIACLMAMIALVVSGWLVPLADLGEVQITLVDVFYLGLVAWWLVGRASARRAGRDVPAVRFGGDVALAFLGYAAIVTVVVLITTPQVFAGTLASFARLAQTATLAWLAPAVICDTRSVQNLLRAAVAGAVVAVGAAVVDAAGSGVSQIATDRYFGGGASINTFGLTSALLVVFGAFGAIGPRAAQRSALILAGITGLLLAKSVGSIFGALIAVALGASLVWGSGGAYEPARRALRLVLLLAVVAVITLSVTQALRPSSSPTSAGFSSGSVSQRLIVADAGLEVFKAHPIIGVGWRRSDEAISDPAIIAHLRRRYAQTPARLFPDVTPTSVHNAYVQILAELGVVGLVLAVYLMFTSKRAISGLLAQLPRGTQVRRAAQSMAMALIVILIWLNENPIYGGQMETVLLALLPGSLAAVARLERANAGVTQQERGWARPRPFLRLATRSSR